MADTDDRSTKNDEGVSELSDQSAGRYDAGSPQLLTPPNKILRKLTLGGQLKEVPFERSVLNAAEERAEAMRGTFEDVVK